MASHTMGPWSVDPLSFNISAIDEKGYVRIADVRGWGHYTGKGHGAWGFSEAKALEIQLANARLIAAAPEMLETLEKVLAWLDPLGCSLMTFGDMVTCVERAIKKAREGE